MATATPRSPGRAEPLAGPAAGSKAASGPLHLVDGIFRFLASLKLAVICLGALAATLAVATKFNSAYGMNAANDYIYQTTWFALILAFLAINVFCAAAIRYPWTKRQTGFVITHVGLLIVIGGSWYGAMTADEGLLNLREGETAGQLVQGHRQVIYVKPVDPHSGESKGEYRIPIRPGAFDWAPGTEQVVTKPADPFKVTVKGFYAASIPREVVKPVEGGRPMLEIRPRVIPPGAKEPMDAFADPMDRWFSLADDRVGRTTRDLGPAKIIVARAKTPEALADFLDPPADPGVEGVARLHYEDRDGKPRRVDVRVDAAKAGAPIPLEGSDLVATFAKVQHHPIESEEEQRLFGTDSLDVVEFAVRKGDAPPVEHHGYGMLPSIPAVIPKADAPAGAAPTPLVRVDYFCPPVIDPKVNRKFGLVEIMADPSGRMAYRVFGRGNPGKLLGHGPLKAGETITAFGGSDVAPMTLTFAVEQFLPSARTEVIAESIDPAPNDRDSSLPAVLAEIKVGNASSEVWLRKSPDFDVEYKTVGLGDKVYELGLDVERLDLGFSLKLNDFDVVFDPGTQNASSYRSEVKLTDPKVGLKDEPKSIYMNHTLDHAGWRFFQTSYYPIKDKSGRPTGEFGSVLQVAKNPARVPIYVGCLVVVLGAFVQFYMRAGVFSDGGKRERERAAEKARRRLEAKSRTADRPKAAPAPGADDEDEPL